MPTFIIYHTYGLFTQNMSLHLKAQDTALRNGLKKKHIAEQGGFPETRF